MKIKRYLVRNRHNEPVAIIAIYRFIKFKKLTKFRFNFLNMLKNEQFDKLDNLITDTLEHLEYLIRYSENEIEKIKLQNKFNGLQDLKRKISATKNICLNKPNDQLAYNKLLNLYNSTKNFL